MRNALRPAGLFAAALVLAAGWYAAAPAEDYAIDTAHTSVTFAVQHLGISWTYGRFNQAEGQFTFDKAAPEKSTFALDINPASIDTGNQKRDEHLKSPDFFNVKEHPVLRFRSTAVQAKDDGYEVAGELTMHGKTQPVRFTLTGGKTAEFPKGTHRIGFTTELKLRRSEFGMTELLGPVGDEIHIGISFEGVKK